MATVGLTRLAKWAFEPNERMDSSPQTNPRRALTDSLGSAALAIGMLAMYIIPLCLYLLCIGVLALLIASPQKTTQVMLGPTPDHFNKENSNQLAKEKICRIIDSTQGWQGDVHVSIFETNKPAQRANEEVGASLAK